jgi:hypothetical protein
MHAFNDSDQFIYGVIVFCSGWRGWEWEEGVENSNYVRDQSAEGKRINELTPTPKKICKFGTGK